MITWHTKGQYQLVYTKDKKTLLTLGVQSYLWSHAQNIGELLSFSRHTHETDYIIAEGEYRIYTVTDEPDFVDLDHLELAVGNKKWQGYLLLTGLPTASKIRRRIVPTDEVISGTITLQRP